MTPECPDPRQPERRFRTLILASALAVLSAAGCDVPTDPPALDSRWIVPADETRYGVAELLAEGEVDFNADSSAFLVNLDAVQVQETLAGICPPCADPLFQGQTVPKPAFSDTLVAGLTFPASVSAFSLTSGSVEVVIQNGLNFDPIRPAAGVTGTVSLEIVDASDGDVLAVSALDGSTTSLAPGTSLVETLVLAPTSVEGDLVLRIALDSPEGDDIVLDGDLSISAAATPVDIEVGTVTVDVSGEAVTLEEVPLDSEDLDAELVERIQEGALVLDIQNPFGVTADLSLEIRGPGVPTLTRNFTVSSQASSRTSLSFTGAELQSFLGQPGVTIRGDGSVDPAAGSVTVSPEMEFVLEASLDMTLRVGG